MNHLILMNLRPSFMPQAVVILFVFGLVHASQPAETQPAARALANTTKIDNERLRRAAENPGDWVGTGFDQAETHYSPLAQITADNVTQLGLAWSRDLGTTRGIEATPIVVDGVMFFTGPWSVVYAVDARNGQELWQWDPKVDKAVYGFRACCDVVNRGVAVYRGRIYVGVLDGRLVALDAATGSPVWQTVTVDQSKAYTITGAPRVVEGQVVIGNGGAELGVRGYVSAYDAERGTLSWRTYVVPGDPALGFESKALEAAARTWKGRWWTAGGGGTCWDGMAYDPELRLLYVGTGNGSPWSRRLRSPGGGDNLYLSSILALKPDTGEVVWHYQTTPGDTWDFTATQPMILADLPIGGRLRKVIMQAPKNGFFYVIDRQSGEFISATNYVDVNWADRIDERGRPVERPGMDFSDGSKLTKPSTYGAHNWHPMAYSPKTRLVYIPAQGFKEAWEDDRKWQYDPAGFNLGAIYKAGADSSPPGALIAWDPVAQKEAWNVPHTIGWNGGVMATAGDLVFQGTGDARFVAYDARNGKVLWKASTGTAIMAAPVSYRVEGKQYVSVLASWGAAYGLANPPGGEAANYEQVGRLYTFALGASAAFPPFPRRKSREPSWPASKLEATPEIIAQGEQLFGVNCAFCHGQGGVLPDLRFSAKEIHLLFDSIVRGGLFAAPKGMPSFKNRLSKEDVVAVQAFVLAESRKVVEAVSKK